jgi:hypothetical protein
MPTPDTNKTLTAAQKDLLRRWILEGAKWDEHWAYVAPKRPAVPPLAGTQPSVDRPTLPSNPIDAFILARLQKEKISPSPAADPITLIRRLSLDLTGLPPTPPRSPPSSPIPPGTRPPPTPPSSSDCSPRLTTANVGPVHGLMLPATPIPTATPSTRRARSGNTAIGSSPRSTAINPTTSSSSTNSPATFGRIPPSNKRWPPASIATPRSTKRAASTPSSFASRP